MRRNRHGGVTFGLILIFLGAVILCAQIMPPGFWWFFIGLGLVVCGLCCLRKR